MMRMVTMATTMPTMMMMVKLGEVTIAAITRCFWLFAPSLLVEKAKATKSARLAHVGTNNPQTSPQRIHTT
ncbi:unnamed protein product [Gongylonema pulchrum]|uniref:Secreted protein n=1 Tax=Gongylonema pulchrum TaxID=637853 RepID=A0A183DP10_9BILA|nr:unnamed protein product [Gongylonema pulchrum]